MVMLPEHRELARSCKRAVMTMLRRKATPLDGRKYIHMQRKVKDCMLRVNLEIGHSGRKYVLILLTSAPSLIATASSSLAFADYKNHRLRRPALSLAVSVLLLDSPAIVPPVDRATTLGSNSYCLLGQISSASRLAWHMSS